MYRAVVTIQGAAPLAQSKQHDAEWLDGESNEDYDKRTWREKCNADVEGNVYVPAMAFKQAMDTAAKRLAIPDPDNKRANLTKYFVSDVICEANLPIGIKKDEIQFVRISANVDGVRGSGKRVPRTLPQTQEWGGKTSFLVMEEKIKPEIFEKVLKTSGQSIGVGQFRAEKGGLNGRFEVTSIKIEKIKV
jgi:hypothetical protein